MAYITARPIDVASVLADIATAESGGIDLFIGAVRNTSDGNKVRRLEYTAYVPMAEKLMGEIEREIRARWPVHRVILIHRIGMLEIGEIAVVTAVSAAHRDAAFRACRYAIDTVKATVPIWKKEFLDEGEVWAEGSAGHASAGDPDSREGVDEH